MKLHKTHKAKPSIISSNVPMIRQILGRVHIGESNLAACREIFKAMVPSGRKRYRALDRWTKRGTIRTILYIHKQHQQTYYSVMGGNLNMPDWAYALQNALCIL
jgi:hypothetical protein